MNGFELAGIYFFFDWFISHVDPIRFQAILSIMMSVLELKSSSLKACKSGWLGVRHSFYWNIMLFSAWYSWAKQSWPIEMLNLQGPFSVGQFHWANSTPLFHKKIFEIKSNQTIASRVYNISPNNHGTSIATSSCCYQSDWFHGLVLQHHWKFRNKPR